MIGSNSTCLGIDMILQCNEQGHLAIMPTRIRKELQADKSQKNSKNSKKKPQETKSEKHKKQKEDKFHKTSRSKVLAVILDVLHKLI
ncbi:unnamed protein product [Rhizophagus irregularis]|nr:unnamed protein product [Rhizophagus irregularis]CAB5357009.1 unnamed protein product [Rhizophagus irregularis]